MEIFLYYFVRLKYSKIPVLDFFYERYGKKFDVNNKKIKIDLANILSKWNYVRKNRGQPDQHYARKQSGFDFIEIHVKRGNSLIRFPYCIDSKENRMIILTGYEKPKNYKKKGKTGRKVEKYKQLAQVHHFNYQKDKNSILKLPQKLNNLMLNN